MIGGGMKNIPGTVTLFHSPKFSVEHILYTIPGGNDVKTSFTSFERDSKWGCRL